ncbi:MAG: cytochrome d ubiquinol oxidase subunit II [Bacteroidales bacterium]|uniref:cytochrome d ubiquinol oxidase subunit II n=1 Tax=Porphyromonas sp. TaxID=1924944 RepID=UPI002973688F|nr:cytochrome d ubiquinol oxidase subunit II [Porphyromonas sp.]MDD7438498.1 cytochrome d ubiquinol oxidase subunit II [Bacteroidales bacterium]MDY3067081.1 cytochrome d ubiquinol oxidase subunit II [Porphyromonas sp.]
MDKFIILQDYWWFIISLLGGLLVFLLFVQGGQSFIFSLTKDSLQQRMLVNSTGRKWEFTFTTLVTFGGAFFAAFPLFYSTSFYGAYWVWMLILFCFVIQAVSFEFQNKKGNIWGKKSYQWALFINGILGPLLLGAAVGTFFTGANFVVDRSNITNLGGNMSVSTWMPFNDVMLHGLEAVLNPWNLVLGLAVLFLARTTGLLYFINNIREPEVRVAARKRLIPNALIFLVFFLAFLGFLLTTEGFAVDPATKTVTMEQYKYLHNLIQQPVLLALFLVGVVAVLYGIGMTIAKADFVKGIWYEGVGVVVVVTILFLLAGWNNTAYYPSFADLQSSLTIRNSSSSTYTLEVMAYASLVIPFVLAYIFYAWKKLDFHKFDKEEMKQGNHY